jgi:hypothetical protein
VITALLTKSDTEDQQQPEQDMQRGHKANASMSSTHCGTLGVRESHKVFLRAVDPLLGTPWQAPQSFLEHRKLLIRVRSRGNLS